MERPWEVVFTALYYVTFSLTWIAILIWQLATQQIHERWTDAFFPLLFAFTVSLLPAVISLGLWTMDNAARLASVLFAVAHAGITVAYIMRPHPARWFLPQIHIALDVLVVACMCRPTVIRAFLVYIPKRSEGSLSLRR